MSLFKKIICLCLVMLVLCSAVGCSFLGGMTSDYFSELTDGGSLLPLGTSLPQNNECEYVSDYLDYWGMPVFRPTKLIAVEKFYERYYIGTTANLYDTSVAVYLAYRTLYAWKSDSPSSPDEVTNALISCYQHAVGDKYAVYLPPASYGDYQADFNASYTGVGIYVGYDARVDGAVVLNVFEDSPAEEAGVQVGDLIIAVNGQDVGTKTYEQIMALLQGAGDTVSLRVSRGDGEFSFTMTKKKMDECTVTWRLLDQDTRIAYIKIEEFDSKTAAQFRRAVDAAEAAGASYLIFDVRGNPGGEINAIADVLDYILADGGPITHFRYKEGSDLEKENTTFYADDGHKITLPMAVLCDASTASAGELFTCALQDYCVATVVGVRTYGKGTMQSMIELPDGSAFTISVALYNPPYSQNYEGRGVIPDFEVALSEEAALINPFLREDLDDAQLQKAVEAVTQGLTGESPLV